MREYIITVADPSMWDVLWDKLTTDGLGDNFIPQRAVEVINERPFNDYCAHFLLTDAEAALIANDPRIVAIELQADLQPGVIKKVQSERTALYSRSSSVNATHKNWGLYRCTKLTNPYTSGSGLNITGSVGHSLDGTGVDIIVVDTGVDPDHPEFAVNADGSGGSRVVDFDWSSLGVTGVGPSSQYGGYLGDGDGHGSNCASIAAGNTCGWAPGAAIYSIRIFDGTDIRSGAALTAIPSDYVYDLVRAFHLQKIANGNTRPTVCTNSWGYSVTYASLMYVNWRGTQYNTTATSATYGQTSTDHPYSITYINTSVDNCAAAGVILTGSAGNTKHKMDVPGGQDYNNYYVDTNFYVYYYHRGGSPGCASSMINVGATELATTTTDGKASFSCSGPRVDIYAPGTYIMGAYANQAYIYPAVPDPRNPAHYLNKISGTSQACPQVAGYAACILQARPSMTAAQAKAFIVDNSVQGVLNELTGTYGTGYDNTHYLQGSANRHLFQPFNSATRGSMTS